MFIVKDVLSLSFFNIKIKIKNKKFSIKKFWIKKKEKRKKENLILILNKELSRNKKKKIQRNVFNWILELFNYNIKEISRK